jgi:hypothetical protein
MLIFVTEKERHVYIQGEILRMEFLHPTSRLSGSHRDEVIEEEDDLVILLLVVSMSAAYFNRRILAEVLTEGSDGQTRLIVFEWDCSTPLETASAQSLHGLRVANRTFELGPLIC